MNELERKRKRIETVVKIGAMLGTALALGPFFFIILQGIGAFFALLGAAAITTIIVNLIPWFATKVANWRLKALKHEASLNPIETLENQYKQREEGLVQFRENILTFHAEVQNFYTELEEHREKYPQGVAKFEEQYNKMRALLANRGQKYKLAQAKLKAFGELIEQKRSEWKIAQAAAKMSKAAGVGEDFISKLMADTAVSSIQTSLNTAFAELEVSLLDELPASVSAEVNREPLQIADKSGPPVLDLDIDVEPVAVLVER